MTNHRLEKLIRKNKVKQARKQLVDDLMKYHQIDISEKEFVDSESSESVRRMIYRTINEGSGIESIKFPYDEKTIEQNVDFVFNYYKNHEKESVLFYPSTLRFSIKTSNQLYLEYPVAISIPLIECKSIVLKLMLDMHNDLIVVSEVKNFGFVFSEDEYSDVTIEYWGK